MASGLSSVNVAVVGHDVAAVRPHERQVLLRVLGAERDAPLSAALSLSAVAAALSSSQFVGAAVTPACSAMSVR